MIEEQGRVVAREPGAIWVETVRAGTCSSCQARQGCGHSVITRQAAGQRARLRVVTDLSFRDGDPVVIGVPEKAVLYGALWVYALPLALLFGGALLGDALSLTLAGRAVDGAALIGKLIETFGVQIFTLGKFHSDPHPGNLLVGPDGKTLSVIDFGQTKELDTDTRLSLARIILALAADERDAALSEIKNLLEPAE